MVLLNGGVEYFAGGFQASPATQRPLLGDGERAPSQDEMIRRNNDALSRQVRVCIPAEVVSWNAAKQTITAQPLIREKIINRQDGTQGFVSLPQLVDVPVCFPQGGDYVLTFPIAAGDEVLIVFADTCIDQWWASGGEQNWNDRRRHDLADAIAVVGINSVPNVIPSIASDATELRSKDGNTKIRLESGEVTITATTINLDGELKINGDNYLAHRHGGVQSGGSLTSTVTP
jgi:hypothetical protein